VTIRLNREQQSDMRALREFWHTDEKKVLLMAFSQFVVATNQLQHKLQEDQNAKDKNTSGGGADTDNGADVLAPVAAQINSDPVAGASAGDNSVPVAD